MINKMAYKQKLFIYDRREMWILLFLGLLVSAFAFTLGVHFGKRVGSKAMISVHKDTGLAATVPDVIPDRNDIVEHTMPDHGVGRNLGSSGANGMPQAIPNTVTDAAGESAHEALREEVKKTHIKLEKPRQVDLPK